MLCAKADLCRMLLQQADAVRLRACVGMPARKHVHLSLWRNTATPRQVHGVATVCSISAVLAGIEPQHGQEVRELQLLREVKLEREGVVAPMQHRSNGKDKGAAADHGAGAEGENEGGACLRVHGHATTK